MTPILRLAGLALAIAIGFASAALAATDEAPGQTPPADQNEPAAQPRPKTAPEPAPEPVQCVKDESGFRTIGARNVFMVELTNQCERKLRCTVRAYIVNSHGPVHGQATLTLGPKSQGPAAHRTHAIKVREAGGMANTSRDCKVI